MNRTPIAQQSKVENSALPTRGVLQRKCGCGNHTVASGECAECQKSKLIEGNAPLIQTKMKISQPNDKYEREADRVADEVMRMSEPKIHRQAGPEGKEDEETIQKKPVASQITPLIQKQTIDNDEKKKQPQEAINPEFEHKSNKDKAKEAVKKTSEAFLKTELGKKIAEKGKEAIASLPGTVITGTAAAGTVAALVTANKALPIQAPAIPLDSLYPGLSMKITVEGPLRNPTNAMISFSGKFGFSEHSERGTPAKTESEKQREENVRMRRELFEFRESLKTQDEKQIEQQRYYKTIADRLAIPGFKSQEGAPAFEEKKEEMPFQRKEINNSTDFVTETSLVQEAVQSTGQPLDPVTRNFMEQRFGYDFSHVKIHTDSKAAASAQSLIARAYTVGRDIIFNSSQFIPHTVEGRKLLAHELVHTIQQGNKQSALFNDVVISRKEECPKECRNCPVDGVVSDGCECLGIERPDLIVPAPIRIKIVRLFGASSESKIKRDIKRANKIWEKAGIEVDAHIISISEGDTEKILGRDNSGRLRKVIQIEPHSAAMNSESTRALIGMRTESGHEKLSVAAGNDVHSLVVYYVSEFNECAGKKTAVGCAFPGVYDNKFFVLIEKIPQNDVLAHELGHIWGNVHDSSKRNIMYEEIAGRGIKADQIRVARQTLSLGSLRCFAAGASFADQERIETEQRVGQFLVREIEGKWSGSITIDGTERELYFQFEVDKKNNMVTGSYWYKTVAASKLHGAIKNGVVSAGILSFDWHEASGQEGKGNFKLSLIGLNILLALTGRWGLDQSSSNGGAWSLVKKLVG